MLHDIIRGRSGTPGVREFIKNLHLATSNHTTSTTCAASYRGVERRTEGGAGVADTREVCRKDAADAYAWQNLLATTAAGVTIQDEGVTEGTSQTTLDFAGAGVSVSVAGATSTVTIPGGGGAGTITVQQADATVDAAVSTLDFAGADFVVTSSPAGEANVSARPRYSRPLLLMGG